MTDEFGHWLAGFIAGEGCFSIIDGSHYGAYRLRFDMNVRADDAAALWLCRDETGLGRVGLKYRHSERDIATWAIASKAECAALVAILDRYPLRAKKAADYAIWRQAVPIWQTVSKGGRGDRNVVAHKRLRELQQTLVAGRIYSPPSSAVNGSASPSRCATRK